MQQYFINRPVADTITLEDQKTVHHITRVMRMEKGDIVALCGLDTACHAARIEGFSQNSVTLSRLYPLRDVTHPLSITLALALIRKQPFELALQKAVELGIEGFIPLSCERSVVRFKESDVAKKTARFEKIAKEAAEQSRRSNVPHIHPASTPENLDLSAYDTILIPYENETTQDAASVFKTLEKGMNVLVVIGPEGGFSDKEIGHFTELGAKTLSLGPRVLRSETAVFYTLSAINYETEGGA